MGHLVKFWDKSRASPIPVAIDFIVAESLSDAVDKSTERLRILKKKYRGDRLGYAIENEAGHTYRTW